MGLLRRIGDAFGLGPRLRNRAGGMAWIKPIPTEVGAGVLAGRAVRTVRLDGGRIWVVDPPQKFIATRNFRYGDVIVWRGDEVGVLGVADEYLEPWREIGDGDTDESAAWVPPLPAAAPAPRRPVDA